MSSGFQLGIIPKNISNALLTNKGRNIQMSKKMSWVRISSALGRNGLTIQSFPEKSTFADKYGNSKRSGNVGVDFSGEAIFAENDRAHRPSPKIDSLNIQNGNKGLSRKATFSITCYTLKQAELLAPYFMEPGYTLLIEFGWNSLDSLKMIDPLSPCEIAKFNNYSYIKNKRENSLGEYDGFMGYITNGGFTNGNDDTYVIDVEVTTLGEIPTYLQAQKKSNPVEKSKTANIVTNDPYKISVINANANSDTPDVGIALFQQMFNRLPGIKQTKQTKSLINKTDKRGNPWSHEGNFINIDETVRTSIMKQLSGNISVNEETVQIPDGLQLIGEQSYIRLELAFELLNQFGTNLDPLNAGCDGIETINYRIMTSNTLIRAHKYMFSIDGSKLFIPNSNLPDFGLVETLTSTAETGTGKLIDVVNPKIVSEANVFGDINYAFPQTKPLENPKDFTIPGSIPIKTTANDYGYLDDLFVNYDFFLEVINRSNYVAKDVYYEILNGISSAANSYWDFEITDLPQKSKIKGLESVYSYQMVVIDSTFVGRVGSVIEGDELKVNGHPIPRFFATGIDSPFLTAGLNIEIPAAKRNSVLGKRSSDTAAQEILTEGQSIELTGNIFATTEDPVIKILNSFKTTKTDDTGDSPNDDTSVNNEAVDAETIREQNLEFFMNRATIIPKIQDRKTEINLKTSFWTSNKSKDKLGAILLVGAWNDPAIFKALEVQHEIKDDDGKNNPAVLGIEFKFDIMGLSGIKIGDLFQIRDLPGKFKNGVFQVWTVEHNLSDNLWKTSVTARQRNI